MHTFINGIAEKNGTTYNQEYENWYNTIEQIGWKETKKEQKKFEVKNEGFD